MYLQMRAMTVVSVLTSAVSAIAIGLVILVMGGRNLSRLLNRSKNDVNVLVQLLIQLFRCLASRTLVLSLNYVGTCYYVCD